jgi:hypothetical protein
LEDVSNQIADLLLTGVTQNANIIATAKGITL